MKRPDRILFGRSANFLFNATLPWMIGFRLELHALDAINDGRNLPVMAAAPLVFFDGAVRQHHPNQTNS